MRTVQLQHDLPDGSSHVDWMLQSPDDPSGKLVSIRLETRLEGIENGASIPGIRLDNHRAAYLDYEGPVSNNRGHVHRLEQGSILQWVCNGDEWWITLKWSSTAIQEIRVSGGGSLPQIGCQCLVYAGASSEPEPGVSER